MTFKEGEVYLDNDGDELIIGPNETYRWLIFLGDSTHEYCTEKRWENLRDFIDKDHRLKILTPLEKALR